MLKKFKILISLKHRRFKRALTKNFGIIGKMLMTILGLFSLIYLFFMAYYSDVILENIFQSVSLKSIIFQATPLIIFTIFIYRLILSQKIDNSAIHLQRIIGNDKSVTFLHLFFNLINKVVVLLFVIFVIVGIKNFYSKGMSTLFLLYLMEIILSIILFELFLLSSRQYFIKESPIKLVMMIISSVAMIGYGVMKFGFPFNFVSINYIIYILTVLSPVAVYLACQTTNKYFEINRYKNGRNYKISDHKQKYPAKFLFSKHILRSSHLRNTLILNLAICLGYFLVLFFSKNPSATNIYGFIYCILYLNLTQFMFAPDYKWIGFLHQGIINIDNYIRGKLNLIQSILIGSIILHSFLCYVMDLKWLQFPIIFMIYTAGSLPYIASWAELKGFEPRDLNNSDLFQGTKNYNRFWIFSIIIIPLIYLYTLAIFFGIGSASVGNNLFTYLSPFIIVGLAGLILHNYWIKKLAEYYKKKRFEIFEKSESV